jgi:hypothetical protein
MKLLPLLPVLCYLTIVTGSPLAEADADADADAQMYQPYGQQGYGPIANQMGGPGYGGSPPKMYNGDEMSPLDAENMDGYGTLDVPSQGNVIPMEDQSGGYNSEPSGFQPDNMGQYMRSPMNYGSPMDNQYMSPPVSSYNPAPPVSSYPQYMPINPYPSRPNYYNNNYQPLNNQGQMYTRSYTPLQGSPCTSVCRSRPMINSRPSCSTACNIKRPSCAMNQPQVDYAVQGQTTFCKPKPIRNPMPQSMGCSGWGCGSSAVNYPASVGPSYPSRTPCRGSSCGGSWGSSPCSGGSCSGGSPCSSSSCSGGSGYNPGTVTGGSGYNPGQVTGGSGYNPGQVTGGSGYNPGYVTGGSGYNPGYPTGGSGYNPGYPTGGSGYNPGYPTGGAGYNPGQTGFKCNNEGCTGSDSFPQQANTLPAQVGSWSDETSVDPAEGSGYLQ